MSHYTTIKTHLISEEHLLSALADMGFTDVEHHASPQPLKGWLGDRRAQGAEIIIRKKHLGPVSNDLGFRRLKDGSFEALVSDMDRANYGIPWMQELTQRYAYHLAKAQLAQQSFDLVEETTEADRTIRLTLRRMT